MARFDTIIFDFDGTLADVPLDFDLMKTKIAALGEVFLEKRPTPNSKPALEWLEELVQQAMQIDEAEAREFRTRGQLVITAMELDAARDGRLFDFTRPTLTDLRDRGISTGVITRNISAAVKTVFPDIDQMIGSFVPRETARALKPDPDHLLQALEAMGARPERTLMIGDHPMDVQTAKAAGAMGAAVTSGTNTADAFRPFEPDFIAADVGTLIAELARNELI